MSLLFGFGLWANRHLVWCYIENSHNIHAHVKNNIDRRLKLQTFSSSHHCRLKLQKKSLTAGCGLKVQKDPENGLKVQKTRSLEFWNSIRQPFQFASLSTCLTGSSRISNGTRVPENQRDLFDRGRCYNFNLWKFSETSSSHNYKLGSKSDWS